MGMRTTKVQRRQETRAAREEPNDKHFILTPFTSRGRLRLSSLQFPCYDYRMTSAPDVVHELVEKFRTNAEHYTSPAYNETLCRVDFINPMFEALGWDMANRAGYADAYRDVIHEDAIKIGGATKAPDYCFRIGGTRKFFLEAKKPGVDLRHNLEPAYQLRRYAWSGKLPLSILTDFQEFAVYDCRVRPDKQDKPSTARIFYCDCDGYPEQWDKIASIFARESVLKGSFDRYAETARGKRGTAEVDAAFLEEIESWRGALARNLALRNKLSQRDLNFAVQRIIDRIIFLRICEDRGIEIYAQLQGLINGQNIYARLRELFNRADERYNSGLFHFQRERDRHEAPDELTPGLTVDDKVLRDIIRSLYYPDSPYEFSVLPADILGQVYEQFLGKVIRLTGGHRAVVEEKPEVRKAGGVYYTPTYIVDYIVRNTVGKLLEGKTPRDVGGLTETFKPSRTQRPIAILDPACGSGSFLIGAYQYLLDWYRDRYVEDGPQAHATGRNPRLYQRSGGDWRLTTAERKRILLAHIYGVDIDSQAVETTKLSLLLKVLEGESGELINQQLRLFHERALPDLGDNIKCGNSLIGPDFYENQQMMLLDAEERLRVNVFDWKTEFSEIMKAGGFDAVIGNPPYVRIQTMKNVVPEEVEYLKRRYVSAGRGNYDVYVVFVERGLWLLGERGRLGYILPHKFLNAQYGEPLRGRLAQGGHLKALVHFGHQQIFPGATTYTCLLFLSAESVDHCEFARVDDLASWRMSGTAATGPVPNSRISAGEWNFAVGESASLIGKLRELTPRLEEVADIFVGLQTSADDVFIMNLLEEGEDEMTLFSRSLQQPYKLEKGLLHPLLSGTDVVRYQPLPSRQYILFPYTVRQEIASLISFAAIEDTFPRTAAYLQQNRSRLESREKGKFRGEHWHRFGRNQNLGIQGRVKLCVPRLVESLHAGHDSVGSHFLDNVDVGGLTFKAGYEKHSFHYLLGLINSRLLQWFFPAVSAPFRGGWYSANRQFLSRVPFRMIDFSIAGDSAKHDRIVSLVEQMLSLQTQLSAAKTAHEKDALQRQIDATDRQIDRLVYELYGLTEEEIAIVEGKT